jgi:2-deoxy-D-gluconate 3-dehydrogenase
MGLEVFSLEDRVVFITGATGGIARTAAIWMAQAGADVVAAARRMPILEEVAQEVRATGRRCLPVSLDVSSMGSIDAAVQAAVDEFGRIDILVNAAAIGGGRVAEEITEEEWDSQMDTNVKGLFFLSQAVGRVMIAQGKGKIINFSSALAILGRETRLTYTTTKAAVIALSEMLALEWAKYNINVNVIAPTLTETAMTAGLIADRELFEAFMRRIPLRRMAQPEELAAACIYLASNASDFITGHTLVVDGGLTVHQEPG